MNQPTAPPTRLEKVVDVLAKLVIALWAGGFVVLVANELAIDADTASVIGVRMLLAGMVVAIVTVVAILGTHLVTRLRSRG